MDINKYNTRVRQAISDELVKCSKRKQEYGDKYVAILKRLENEVDTLSYREYKKLEDEKDFLVEMQQIEDIRYDIWDKAREICLNIADEY